MTTSTAPVAEHPSPGAPVPGPEQAHPAGAPAPAPNPPRKHQHHHKAGGPGIAAPAAPAGASAAAPTRPDGARALSATQIHWASAGLGTFTAVGFLRTMPDLAENRAGCIAYFSVQLSQDRELDLRMVGGSKSEIERRLKGIAVGMAVTVVGHIVGPRIGFRESPAHFADRIIPHPGHAIV